MHVTHVSELKPDGLKIGVSAGSQKRGHRGQAAQRGPRRAPGTFSLQPAFGRAGQASHESLSFKNRKAELLLSKYRPRLLLSLLLSICLL